MSVPDLRLLFCAAVVVSLAGCGGSSGSSGGGPVTGNPTLVTFTFNGMPVAVASQIGTGPYSLATLTSGKLTLSIPSGESNFSVAYLCPSPAGSTVPQNIEFIRQSSILDGTSYSAACFQASTAQTGTATLQVNAAAIPGAAWVGGGIGEMQWSGSTLNFSSPLTVGTYDIPVSVSKNVNFVDNYLSIRILRAQTVPGALNGGAPLVFTANDEIAPQTITYANVPSGYSLLSPFVTFETGGGAEIVLNQDGPTGQYLAVPSGSVQSGDSYFFAAVAQGDPNSSTAGALVGVERYTSAGGPQSFTLPAPWDYAGPTAAALPTFNFVYSGFSGSANVTDLANLTWFLGTGAIDEITMTSTANYQGGSTAMTVPDLSSLTGFLTPPTSGPVNWSANVYQGNFTDTKPLSGTIQYVGKNGAYTLP